MAFSDVALLIGASYHVNKLSGWCTPPGRFLTAVKETGLYVLILPITIATILFIIGLYILSVELELKEYFKKVN